MIKTKKISFLILVIILLGAFFFLSTMTGKSIFDFLFKSKGEISTTTQGAPSLQITENKWIEKTKPPSSGYYLVKVEKPLNVPLETKFMSEKGNKGVRFFKKIGENTYSIYYDGSDWPAEIKSYFKFKPEDKIPVDFKKIKEKDLMKSDDGFCEVTIFSLDPSKDLSMDLGSLGLYSPVRTLFDTYIATIPDCNIKKLKEISEKVSKIDSIWKIQPTPQPIPALYDVRRILDINAIHQGNTPYNLPYTGKGKHFGIWDISHIKKHDDFKDKEKGGYRFKPRDSFGLFVGKFINIKLIPPHGTWVSSVILGNGERSNGKYKGIAPESFGESYTIFYAASEFLDAVSKYGIVVGQNAWHYPGRGFLFGAKADDSTTNGLWNDIAEYADDVPLVFAAGNAAGECSPEDFFCNLMREYDVVCDKYHEYNGRDYDCLYDPSSAKNVITVGAVDKYNKIASFSSRGPAWDGRLKPDLVAPGVDITAVNIIKNQEPYDIYEGTSFSSPAVSGSVILLQQFFDDRDKSFIAQNKQLIDQRANVIKTLLIHTAKDLGLPGPDFEYGWGLVQPKKAMEVAEKNTIVEDAFNEYNKNKKLRYPVHVPKVVNRDLKVTLGYLDFPVPIKTTNRLKYRKDRSELTNDLDLVIENKVGEPLAYPFLPNYEKPWNPAKIANKTNPNNKDNIEQAIVPKDILKKYAGSTIYVTVNATHPRIIGSKVRIGNSNVFYPEQKFALIVGDEKPNSPLLTCGNGKLDEGEECDMIKGGVWDFKGKTCNDFETPGHPKHPKGFLTCDLDTCTIDSTTCFVPDCGDGKVEHREMCDPNNPVKTCGVGCYPLEAGPNKACKCMCETDEDCQGPGRENVYCKDGVCTGCGDGELEATEDCDLTSLVFGDVQQICDKKYGIKPVIGQNQLAGELPWICYKCHCFHPPGGEHKCGDKVNDRGEECDNGKWNGIKTWFNVCNAGNGRIGFCTKNCRCDYCGDGNPDGWEQCDFGGLNSRHGRCNPFCEWTKCGDGFVQKPNGMNQQEECDTAHSHTNTCIKRKKTGEMVSGFCKNCECHICGDGKKNLPWEDCDDGNNDNTDKCNDKCRFTKCGDGIVQKPNGYGMFEQCESKKDCPDSEEGFEKHCYDCECYYDTSGKEPKTYCGDGIIQKPNDNGVLEDCEKDDDCPDSEGLYKKCVACRCIYEDKSKTTEQSSTKIFELES